MKRRPSLRESRLMHAAVGVTVIAAPSSAALADASQPAGPLQSHVKSHRLRYGQAVVVDGHAPTSDAGQAIELGFAPSGSTSWQPIASSQVRPDGGFRLSAPLHTSGSVKVSITSASVAGSPVASTAAAAPVASTAPQHITVAALLRVRRRTRALFGGRRIEVHGRLLSTGGRHRVLLQGRSGRRWSTLARGVTGPTGRFDLRYRAAPASRDRLRVRFPGDRSNAPVTASAGRLIVFRPSLASWYVDAGTTACGFHAQYGVANLSLPCGARVSFSYGTRRVTAVVDDRGPYVGGREWDLNQNTAAALGFAGVGTVWSSR